MKLIITIISLHLLLSISFGFNLNFQTNLNVEPSEYAGKKGIVTGGSAGIGKATALLFAQKGMKIVFCARNSNPDWFTGEAAEAEINADPVVKASGGSVSFFKADVSNSTDVQAFVKFAAEQLGEIDFLINNAGIGGWLLMTHQLNYTDLLKEHDSLYVNVYGTLNMQIALTAYWMENGNPNKTYSIVNLASYNGIRSCPNCTLYGTSKYAIIGLTKSVALEYADTHPRIRANAIAPGLTETPLVLNQAKYFEYGEQTWEGDNVTEDSELWKKWGPVLAANCHYGRLADAVEQANVALFFISDRASYVSGAVYTADGSQSSD